MEKRRLFTGKYISFLILWTCRFVGKSTLDTAAVFGKFGLFIWDVIRGFRPPIYWKNLWIQIVDIAYFSIIIVSLTGFFTGAVMALQMYNAFRMFGAESSIPIVVAISLSRELGPVLTGLMISGRVASRMAAEVGAMRIDAQISSMWFLEVNPIKFIVMPRILAAIISVPILTFLVDVVGFLGGYIVCVYNLEISGILYIRDAMAMLKVSDVLFGLLKGTIFGGIVGIVGCYMGYNVNGGTHEVGRATTNAVVMSSVLILVFNYITTSLFF